MGKPKRKRVKCWEDCLLPEYRVIAENGCWIWTGSLNGVDYPFFRRNGRDVLITRLALEVTRGEPLGDLEACHHCDYPPCFNPEHLFAGTHKDNMLDMARKSRAANQVNAPGKKIKRPRRPNMPAVSGIKGIHHQKGTNAWSVARLVKGRYKRFGTFDRIEDAIKRNDEVNACLTPP